MPSGSGPEQHTTTHYIKCGGPAGPAPGYRNCCRGVSNQGAGQGRGPEARSGGAGQWGFKPAVTSDDSLEARRPSRSGMLGEGMWAGLTPLGITMKSMRSLAAVLVVMSCAAFVSGGAAAQSAKTLRERLVGTWTFVIAEITSA